MDKKNKVDENKLSQQHRWHILKSRCIHRSVWCIEVLRSSLFPTSSRRPSSRHWHCRNSFFSFFSSSFFHMNTRIINWTRDRDTKLFSIKINTDPCEGCPSPKIKPCVDNDMLGLPKTSSVPPKHSDRRLINAL